MYTHFPTMPTFTTQHLMHPSILLSTLGIAAAMLQFSNLSAAPDCCPDGDAFQPQAQSAEANQAIRVTGETARNLGLTTAVASVGHLPEIHLAIGRTAVVPGNEAIISSRIAGRASAVAAREGDTVETGQLILEVESLQPGSPPPSIAINAPISGTLTNVAVRRGQPVAPGDHLAVVQDFSSLYGIATIAANRIALLDTVSEVRVTTTAYPDQYYTATFERVADQADPRKNTIDAYFRIDNTNGRLRPGMRLEVQLHSQTERQGILVPLAAIQGQYGKFFVYKQDPDDPLLYHPTAVVVHAQNRDQAWVEGNVHAGDAVLVKGAYLLGFAGAVEQARIRQSADDAHGHTHGPDGDHDHDHDDEPHPAHGAGDHDDHDSHAGSHSHGDFHDWLLYTFGASTALLLILLILQTLVCRRPAASAAAPQSETDQ